MSRTSHFTLLLIYLWTLSSCNLSYSASTPITATSQSVALAIQPPSATSTSATDPGSATDTQPVIATLTNTSIPSTQTATLPNFVVGSTIQHQVIPGEWMLQIARCYGADFSATRRANPQIFNPDIISAGMIITVPNIGSTGAIYGPPCVGYHTVQTGDTWNSIAQAHNADVVILQAANRGALSVGRVLRVPLNSASGIAQPPTSSSPTLTLTTSVESSKTAAPTTSPESSVTPMPTASPESTPIPAAATSGQLIDQALAAGAINAETALLYKVYASFSDNRLPVQYRGDDSQVLENNIISAAADQYENLSPAAQAILDPFLLPPTAPDSWVNLPTVGTESSHLIALRTSMVTAPPVVWRTIHNPGSKVKVWYETRYVKYGDDQKAQIIANEMDNKIWKKLTEVMGVPGSDKDETNNGGDDLFDIYLVHSYNDSRPYDNDNPCSNPLSPHPEYMLLDSRQANLLPIAAHELMHAIIASYENKEGACDEYDWLDEASATWAMDFVYGKEQNIEHHWATVFLDLPDVSLFTLPKAKDEWGYNAYLFLFFLTHSSSPPSLIRTIWENTKQFDSLESIDRAIPGGFQGQWPLFARANWNRDGIDDYKKWDDLTYAVVRGQEKVIQAQQVDYFEARADILPLTAVYFHYNFDDVNTSSVLFVNTLFGIENASVQALVRYDGKSAWEPYDETKHNWTNEYSKFFCRDKKEERLAELVLIIANSEWKDRGSGGQLQPSEQPKLYFSNIGCWQWTGTVTSSEHTILGDQVDVTHSWEAKVTFQRKDSTASEVIPSVFILVGGQADWSSSVKYFDCSGNFRDSFTITDDPSYSPGLLQMTLFKKEPYSGSAGILLSDFSRYKLQCSEGSTPPPWGPSGDFWQTPLTDSPVFEVTSDGRTLDGFYTVTVDDPYGFRITTNSYDWHFKAEREP